MDKSKLGYTFTDRITGYTGVCTGCVCYITGCDQLLLVGKSEGGKPGEAHWFDQQRCVQTDALQIELDNSTTPGCDVPAPRR